MIIMIIIIFLGWCRPAYEIHLEKKGVKSVKLKCETSDARYSTPI